MFNRFVLSACALGLVAVTAVPASALTVTNSEERVSVADLDLSTKAGRETLDRRLDTAVRKACGARPAIRDFDAMSEFRLCLANARESYKQQLRTIVRNELVNERRVAVVMNKLGTIAMR